METQARKIFNKCRNKEKQQRRKVLITVFSIVAGVFLLVSIICFAKFNALVGGLVLLSGAFVLLFSSLLVFIIFKSYFYSELKEVTVDGVEIGAFVGYAAPGDLHGVDIHLIINGKDNYKFVQLKTYYDYGIDSVLFLQIANYTNDKIQDKKNGTNIALLTKNVGGKEISAIYEKYSKKLVIKVDGKVY